MDDEIRALESKLKKVDIDSECYNECYVKLVELESKIHQDLIENDRRSAVAIDQLYRPTLHERDVKTLCDSYAKSGDVLIKRLKCVEGLIAGTNLKRCGICFEICDCRVLKCEHTYCLPCLTRYMDTVTRDIAQLPCKCPECKEVVDVSSVSDCVDSNQIKVLQHAYQVSLLNRPVVCPKCDACFERPNGTKHYCPKCSTALCLTCHQVFHEGFTCKEYQNFDDADLAFIRVAREKMWAKCPRCGIRVEKSMGCNHITCRCGDHFCYV
jgi:hypothetical protein